MGEKPDWDMAVHSVRAEHVWIAGAVVVQVQMPREETPGRFAYDPAPGRMGDAEQEADHLV